MFEDSFNTAPYKKEQATLDARHCLLTSSVGCLSTIVRENHELEFYPMASVTPYVLDNLGNPVVLISDIAEHTKNANKSQKASLFIRQSGRKLQAQTGWRLTVIGDLRQLKGEEADNIAERYYKVWPEAVNFHKIHDFNFWQLSAKKLRFIKGPGKISWVSADSLFTPNPFPHDAEQSVIEHMNKDHVGALKTYLQQQGIATDKDENPAMTSLNQYGFSVRYDNGLYFVPFPELVRNSEEVRKAMVGMLHR